MTKIGVLALQGDVREHRAALERTGVHTSAVRTREDLGAVDGLVLPGGESTTIAKLARTFGLFEPIRQRLAAGLPAYGSCAGMILLADRVLDARPDQHTFGGLDVTVRRNAFGRQVDSFECDLEVGGVDGPPVHAVFIRAPWVEQAASRVQILATVPHGPAAGRAVAVRQGQLLATSFHPEVTGDDRLHRYFAQMVRSSGR